MSTEEAAGKSRTGTGGAAADRAVRRVAVIGGSRIPFARSSGPVTASSSTTSRQNASTMDAWRSRCARVARPGGSGQ